MNKGPSKRPTSPEILPPRYISGLLSWWASQAIRISKTNYSEHIILQKTHVRVYLVEISNNEDLKCVYMSTKSETQTNRWTYSAYKKQYNNKHSPLNTSDDANADDGLVE